ncbi:unnamed protein product [Scytosiphon promiscuus]
MCYSCYFRETSRFGTRWPLMSLALPNRPQPMVSFEYLGPLPDTRHGKENISLVMDLFSRQAEGFTPIMGERNAKIMAQTLVNDYIRDGDAQIFLSDRGPEFARTVFKMLGSAKKGHRRVSTAGKWDGWRD